MSIAKTVFESMTNTKDGALNLESLAIVAAGAVVGGVARLAWKDWKAKKEAAKEAAK